MQYLRPAVLSILFVDCFFILTTVRQYLQILDGPHVAEGWFDPTTALKVCISLTIWIVGWLYLWIEDFVSRDEAQPDSSMTWWAVANIVMALLGIVSIAV
jgi:hypothetical protein